MQLSRAASGVPAAKARALSAVTATAQGAARDALDYVEKQLAMEH